MKQQKIDSMKKIPGILAAVSVFCLMAFVSLQEGTIEGLKEELNDAALQLEDTEMRLENMTEEKLLLEEEVEELQEEIEELSEKVTALENEIAEHKEKLGNLRKRVSKLEEKAAALQNEIDKLRQDNGHNSQIIKTLQEEKEQLQQEVQYHLKKEEVLKEVHNETVQEVANAEVERQTLNNLRDFILSAKVNFHQIDLWKNEGAGTIKKLRKQDKRWKYTSVQLSIEHENEDLLKDLDFVLKILDVDTGQILPFNENNPQYPNSELGTNGYVFKYHENLAEVLYYNNETKRSMNYEVRVYVKIDNEEILLTNGKTSLIQHGKVVDLNP